MTLRRRREQIAHVHGRRGGPSPPEYRRSALRRVRAPVAAARPRRESIAQPADDRVREPERPGEHRDLVDPQRHADRARIWQRIGAAIGEPAQALPPRAVAGDVHVRRAEQSLRNRRRRGRAARTTVSAARPICDEIEPRRPPIGGRIACRASRARTATRRRPASAIHENVEKPMAEQDPLRERQRRAPRARERIRDQQHHDELAPVQHGRTLRSARPSRAASDRPEDRCRDRDLRRAAERDGRRARDRTRTVAARGSGLERLLPGHERQAQLAVARTQVQHFGRCATTCMTSASAGSVITCSPPWLARIVSIEHGVGRALSRARARGSRDRSRASRLRPRAAA